MTTLELDSLDAIIERRRGGSDNIRGIRYQILYSIRHSLTLLLDSGAQSVRLEGAEDFDYVNVESGNVHVQIKTSRSSRPWSLSNLEKPFKSFLEVHRASPTAQFVLAVDFSSKNDLQRLFNRELLDADQRKRIDEKFLRQMAPKLGASRAEAENLLNRVRFETTPEHELKLELLAAVCSAQRVGPDRAALHVGALVYQFLTWAEAKATLTIAELAQVFDGTERIIAQSHPDYDAFKKHLLEPVSWSTEGSHSDYFDGKAARPDHIGAGLDVTRQKWLDRIDGILSGRHARICLLRASSGQGKSTLMYRYAHDYWDHKYILRINHLETSQDAADVNYYLRDRAALGRPYLILIDGIGASRTYWYEVAQECASLGFPMIATVRHEDWFQHGNEHTVAYQPLDPTLELDEARAIHASLLSQRRLAKDAPLPEVAFEQVGKPPLLIEYVFLITQGKMLEDRIRDQLRSIGQSADAAAKKRILRRVSLAHSLGSPMEAIAATKGLSYESDSSDVLGSLLNEYVSTDNERVSGIHWVRSSHISRILHETLSNEHETVLDILEQDAVPEELLPNFITNALTRSSTDTDKLMHGLVRWAKQQSLSRVVQVVEGIFKAGEAGFLEHCRPILDEADARSWGLRDITAWDLAPRTSLNSLSSIAGIVGELGDNMARLAAKLPELRSMSRGTHLVHVFLDQLLTESPSMSLVRQLGAFGRILLWCAITEVRANSLDEAIRHIMQEGESLYRLTLREFVDLSYALFIYDAEIYNGWYDQRQEEILHYLQLLTDSISIRVLDGTLSVEYMVDHQSDASPNDQSMQRLDALRSALPFCQSYRATGIWMLPYQMTPSVDDSQKNIQISKLHPASDVRLNAMWGDLVEATYATDSIYQFQEAWHRTRMLALQYVRRLAQELRRHGRSALPGELLANQANGSLLAAMCSDLVQLPPAPPQTPKNAKDAFDKRTSEERSAPEFARVDAQKWCQSIQSFGRIARQYADNVDQQAARLIVLNLREAHAALPALHDAFAELFRASSDYFRAERLNQDEIKEYSVLADVLGAALLDPPSTRQKDLLRYARSRLEEDARCRLATLSTALSAQIDSDTEIGLPSNVLRRSLQVAIPFTFSVKCPCNMNPERDAIHAALTECLDVADQFLMIPLYLGGLLDNVAFTLSQHQLRQMAGGQDIQWESYLPQPVSSDVLTLLPNVEVSPPAQYVMRQRYEEILIRAEMISRTAQLIAPLSASSNRYDKELTSNHIAKLDAEKSKIAGMIEPLLRQIDVSCWSDGSDKKLVLKTLNEARHFLRASGTDSFNVRFEPEMRLQNQVATRFFCSTLA